MDRRRGDDCDEPVTAGQRCGRSPTAYACLFVLLNVVILLALYALPRIGQLTGHWTVVYRLAHRMLPPPSTLQRAASDGETVAVAASFDETATLRVLRVFGAGEGAAVNLGAGRTCVFTSNRSAYNASDAAVFRGDRMRLGEFPVYRPPHQKWIYRTMETPVNTVMNIVKRVLLKQQVRFVACGTCREAKSEGNCGLLVVVQIYNVEFVA